MSEFAERPLHVAAPEVRVSVTVQHLAAHSRAGRQVFSYLIRIENHAADSWQIMARHWQITDGSGRETRVEGEGVIGQQPIIAPGGVFVYDSFVTLEDVPGSMSGYYELRDAWGQTGRAPIPAFALAVPTDNSLRELN
ncbi:Co2+/Mg2+ efflux protein ApaG [Deinococcus psychrotolerans]|uniref:Co2+/Mg2+ efflux protein ApaG n=1 Tax=Deinococcus psychrotolerans TaxID=2489213 RepID=A0A3G8YL67_9DEIO|nr:Co2+/Mg2+ efflux protein ApaG [Deinococcus psychrotolerans]AZI43344.1 Co2+/Mg2+ efflux protein ApaG [Deinococcus psychrotolerans]